MRIDLRGRTALVTGSTSGIGLAVAAALAEAGTSVVVNGRDPERAEEVARVIGQRHGVATDLRGVGADVGTADGCAALIEAVPDVDVLVNNAGVFTPQPVFDIPDEEWTRHFDVNVMSGVRLARHHVPRMVERGWGRVVFVSSESALQIPVEMVHYGMTKTAQLAVSRGMAEAVPGSGVTVNSILPGPTLTEGLRAMLDPDGTMDEAAMTDAGRAFVAENRPTSLIGRLASPDEVAALVVYLASEQASATTGAALRVDGGLLRSIV
ncbi:SDR family NAD(P)-dependent oxidoreductase [Miltoncostaea oceani]|uniref:SDR family NAD(P)-dependent oxidoreductase n=1 Tax=Miltoncostaea oceani TaxID=2843216 RepID=UPI001C3DAA54|nr:SDR family oxidoreductase [Miltoncostaea oceani]